MAKAAKDLKRQMTDDEKMILVYVAKRARKGSNIKAVNVLMAGLGKPSIESITHLIHTFGYITHPNGQDGEVNEHRVILTVQGKAAVEKLVAEKFSFSVDPDVMRKVEEAESSKSDGATFDDITLANPVDDEGEPEKEDPTAGGLIVVSKKAKPVKEQRPLRTDRAAMEARAAAEEAGEIEHDEENPADPDPDPEPEPEPEPEVEKPARTTTQRRGRGRPPGPSRKSR
jgi:hypothetical protein